jgi:hypothetical protein
LSESYKISGAGLYYVIFAVVGWLDVFTRWIYQDIFMGGIKFCQEKKGLIINLLHYEAEQSSKNYKTRSTASRLRGTNFVYY